MTNRLSAQTISTAILTISGLFFLAVCVDRLSTGDSGTAQPRSGSIVERQAGIERARQANGEYSFTTSFIPGIDQAASPDRLKQDFIKNNPGAVTD